MRHYLHLVPSSTRYQPLRGGLNAGSVSSTSTETNQQTLTNNQFTFSQLGCNVEGNGITNPCTLNLRANAGNAGPTVSIPGNSTGQFFDNINTYSALSTDQMAYQIVTASAGTTITFVHFSVSANLVAPIVAGVTTYKNFRNVRPGLPLIPRLLDISNQYTTFG